MTTLARRALLALVFLTLPPTCPAAPDEISSTLAPGYRALPFRPPQPGSYRLPTLGTAADGEVLDSDGKSLRLHDLYGDKLVVLSFIYATCDDINGCPLATSVFRKLATRLKSAPNLADRLRLVTMSFNPEHDTPAVMARYGEGFRDAGPEWRFLTAASEARLLPILQAYGQSAEKEIDEQGRPTGKFSHLLRVFLIDRDKNVRNIYTVSVLHPDLILADAQTLLAETPGAPTPEAAPVSADARLLRAGDDKSGYADADYRTHSVALAQRRGKAADLYRLAQTPPRGLPKLPVPKENPLSREKIALGRKLFYDRRLSPNNTFSCAMCHIPEQGFASQEQATAVGIEGRTVRRNSPTLYNVAYMQKLFHDGRESSLENQVWGPLLAANEMGNPSIGFVADKLKSLPDYRGLFERAFRRPAGMETVGQAIAAYERTLISANSPFDRWRYGGEASALDAQAQQGYALFAGKAGCARCHTVGEREALLTDGLMHNTGVGYRDSMKKAPERTKVQLAPGVTAEIDGAAIAQVGAGKPNDLGLYEITQNPADRWKYKTPSLRNVALTAPYMHNGSLGTLRQVVEFYNAGGEPNDTLDPAIRPLGLSEAEIDALTHFLESLTGDNVDTLVLDAFAAPVGN